MSAVMGSSDIFTFQLSDIPSASDTRKITEEIATRKNKEMIEANELNLERLASVLVDLIEDYSHNGKYFFNLYFNIVQNQVYFYSFCENPSFGIDLTANQVKTDFMNSFKYITSSCIFQKQNLERLENLFVTKGYKFTFEKIEKEHFSVNTHFYHLFISWELNPEDKNYEAY